MKLDVPIWTEADLSLSVSKGTMRNLFPDRNEANIHQLVRWFLQLPFGYRIYSLFRNEKKVGHCVVSNGGNPRYPFAKRNDIIIGPYFTTETERGKGLSKLLVGKVLNDFERGYNNAYAFIAHDNIASQKTAQACGMKYVFDASYTHISRRLVKVEAEGGMMMFRRERDLPGAGVDTE